MFFHTNTQVARRAPRTNVSACTNIVRSLIALILLAFISLSFLPNHIHADSLRPVVVATGFEANVFAGPADIPDFAQPGLPGAFAGPTAIAFDSRGRLFVATYSGKIFILLDNNDDGHVDQVKTFASRIPIPLGMAFRADGDLYITSNVQRGVGRIIRLRDRDGDDVAEEQTVIVDNLPSQGEHQTDRLRFGPDGLLYVGQGSSTDNGTPGPNDPPEGPLNGTMLRLDPDTAQVEVYATGLRNPFGMAFHPDNGELFATDGGSGEVCQINCDPSADVAPPEEVNWVVPGGNYGFPQCEGTPSADRPGCMGVRAPAIQYPRHLTPTALAFYTGPQAGEHRNELLLTLYKNLPNEFNYGGDLRRLRLDGNSSTGFQLTDLDYIIQFDQIDPFDGPVDTAIDPISGDIYVVRFDPVNHPDQAEHHHFIYRIHRKTSDQDDSDKKPFIGSPSPSAIKAGSPTTTISIVGKHLKPGAVVLDTTDNITLNTRQGATIFDLVADLPASAISTERSLVIAVRNPDTTLSNPETIAITKGDPNQSTPRISSLFVYKKKRSKVVDPVSAGSNAKKLRLVVSGSDFDAGAQLLVNNVALQLDSSSGTELIGLLTNQLLASAGDLNVQVRNSTGKVSNTIKLTIAP
jgi:glucose/arabinose dehydrogenase